MFVGDFVFEFVGCVFFIGEWFEVDDDFGELV